MMVSYVYLIYVVVVIGLVLSVLVVEFVLNYEFFVLNDDRFLVVLFYEWCY